MKETDRSLASRSSLVEALRGASLPAGLSVVAWVLVACGQAGSPPADTAVSEPPTPELASAPSSEPAATGAADGSRTHRADLMSAQGGQVGGAIDLVASDGGVTLTGLVTGLKPDSVHGFHVHEKGDCSSADFKSAGDHFNPTSAAHGDPQSGEHHLGDAPNIRANEEGKAEVNVRIDGATLGDGGANDLVGKAIVVHEKEDDYRTQPSGNSGDRIACGVIR